MRVDVPIEEAKRALLKALLYAQRDSLTPQRPHPAALLLPFLHAAETSLLFRTPVLQARLTLSAQQGALAIELHDIRALGIPIDALARKAARKALADKIPPLLRTKEHKGRLLVFFPYTTISHATIAAGSLKIEARLSMQQ